MIQIVGYRKGSLYYPFSDDDREAGLAYQEHAPLSIKITGAKKMPFYVQLCCYFGSCQYISELSLNKNMNTKEKVDILTRIKCGFVKDTIVIPNGGVQWIVKSLSYENCEQPDRTAFINKALIEHAALAKVFDVDRYIRFLNTRS